MHVLIERQPDDRCQSLKNTGGLYVTLVSHSRGSVLLYSRESVLLYVVLLELRTAVQVYHTSMLVRHIRTQLQLLKRHSTSVCIPTMNYSYCRTAASAAPLLHSNARTSLSWVVGSTYGMICTCTCQVPTCQVRGTYYRWVRREVRVRWKV